MESEKRCWFCKISFTSEEDVIKEEIEEIEIDMPKMKKGKI